MAPAIIENITRNHFYTLKKVLIALFILNIILCVILCAVADKLADDEIDHLKPKPDYPELIKKSILIGLILFTILAIILNGFALYGVIKERQIIITIYLVLGLIGLVWDFYAAIFERKANVGLHWFEALWLLLNWSLTVLFWYALRQRG